MAASGARRGLGRDGVLAAVLTLLLVLAVATFGRGQSAVTDHPGSSQAAGPEGAKALYLLLDRLGHRVERRTQAPGDAGPARVLFVLSPEVSMEGADLPGLRRWIERGGTLVYGAGGAQEPEAFRLRDALGLGIRRLSPKAFGRETVTLSDETAPARTLSVGARFDLRAGDDEVAIWAPSPPQPMSAPARRRRDGAASVAVAVVARGKGRVIVVGDGGLASNLALGQADNAVFLTWLAERYGAGAPVVFDEWSHGYGAAAGVLHLGRAQGVATVVLAVLALLLYAVAAGRRLGVASDEPAPPRPATVEQVRALARFYGKSGARRAALMRLGVVAPPAVASDAEMVALARRALSGNQ